MNNNNYRYSVGDIVKIGKISSSSVLSHRVGVVIEAFPSFRTIDYKVIISGLNNSYYWVAEYDIEGKIEDIETGI